MGYTEVLNLAIYAIAVVGVVLGTYVSFKIYSKKGFR